MRKYIVFICFSIVMVSPGYTYSINNGNLDKWANALLEAREKVEREAANRNKSQISRMRCLQSYAQEIQAACEQYEFNHISGDKDSWLRQISNIKKYAIQLETLVQIRIQYEYDKNINYMNAISGFIDNDAKETFGSLFKQYNSERYINNELVSMAVKTVEKIDSLVINLAIESVTAQ